MREKTWAPYNSHLERSPVFMLHYIPRHPRLIDLGLCLLISISDFHSHLCIDSIIFLTALVATMLSSVCLSVIIFRFYLYARSHSNCHHPDPPSWKHGARETRELPFSGELADYWALWIVQEGPHCWGKNLDSSSLTSTQYSWSSRGSLIGINRIRGSSARHFGVKEWRKERWMYKGRPTTPGRTWKLIQGKGRLQAKSWRVS